jgi:hypothetical protein
MLLTLIEGSEQEVHQLVRGILLEETLLGEAPGD